MERNEKVELRKCLECGKKKPLSDFRLMKDRWRKHTCKKCMKARYFAANKSKVYEYRKARERRTKEEVITHYGGKCNCCGETIIEFLTMDHIHGGGRKHAKELKKTRFFMWVKRNNYPDYLQVLCFNCNCGREVNGGICPHQLERR